MKVKAAKPPVRVMVVDDSAVIRGLFVKLLEADPEIEIVNTASTGSIALELLQRHPETDVITLDIQMPDMDGLTALPKILEIIPHVQVIMASTLTKESAEETMKSFELGAAECLAKPVLRTDREAMYMFSRELVEKVRALGRVAQQSEDRVDVALKPKSVQVETKVKPQTKYELRERRLVQVPKAIAIGSSTGGPPALHKLFTELKGRKLNVPMFITQHMPPQFTAILAKQLGDLSGLDIKEGEDGEAVVNGRVYVAPGDYHMTVEDDDGYVHLSVKQGEPENFCRPAVDPMLRSMSKVFNGQLLILMLTGMGSDGLQGSRIAVEDGATVIAQDEESSVVWGMPGAVTKDGLCTDVLPLTKITDTLIEFSQGRIG